MLGKAIGWIFDLIGGVWTAFWNAFRGFLGLIVLTAISGAIVAASAKLYGMSDGHAWLAFKYGACAGFALGALRLLLRAHVNMVHGQEARARMEARRQLDLQLAKGRAVAQQESISNRLKHLN